MGSDKETIQIGDWTLDPPEGRLRNRETTVELEPKTVDVLVLLYRNRGQVLTQEQILEKVWTDTIVSPGALARCISKLRKALGDDAQSPRYIETLPKRGYRLLDTQTVEPTKPTKPIPYRRLMSASAVLLLIAVIAVLLKRPPEKSETDNPLLSRADDFYYQYTRADNESAMALYERVLAEKPDSAPATLGLANTLIQTVIRWPENIGEPPAESPDLKNALATQRLDSPRARLMLQRAESLALRAVRLDANNPKTHRTLGLVYASMGRFDEAHRAYDQAIELDPLAWGALINKGELFGIQGQPEKALKALEDAYAAMTEVYDREPVRVRPWYPELGNGIGDRYAAMGRVDDAEVWYRRVLDHTPLHVDTTIDLARLLYAAGDTKKAAELCRSLTTRVGPLPECLPFTQQQEHN